MTAAVERRQKNRRNAEGSIVGFEGALLALTIMGYGNIQAQCAHLGCSQLRIKVGACDDNALEIFVDPSRDIDSHWIIERKSGRGDAIWRIPKFPSAVARW